MIGCVKLWGEVSKTREPEETIVQGALVEEVEVITSTYGRPDGDWVKPCRNIRFRTLNGHGCTVKVNRNASTFNNCKLVFSSAYAPKDGEYSTNYLQIESLDGSPYSYRLRYEFNWN